MNNEDFVSYEIAKALNQLGYDGSYEYMYATENFCYGSSALDFHTICIGERISPRVAYYKNYKGEDAYRGIPCPSLAQAQKWLREKKGIYVYPEINALKKWFAKAVDMCKNEDLIWDGTMFDTYESALSAGIEAALKLIEEGAR